MRNAFLYSHNPAIGLKVLYCLHSGGFRVHVIAARASSYLKFSRYCTQFDAIEASDVATAGRRLVEKINSLSETRGYEAVLADDIGSHALLNEVSARIRIPAFAPATKSLLETCHDKWSFYEHMLEAGLPAPQSVRLTTLTDLTEAKAAEVGFPILVKPLHGESGHGIRRFDDFRVLQRYFTAPGPYKTFPLKLQRLIPGSTIGLSFLALNGEILSHDIQRHAADGSRVFEHHPDILEISRQIIAHFNYGGPGHIDFVRDHQSGQAYALEFNCRYWYSLPVSLWHGGNFPSLAVELARGHSIPFSPTRPGAYFQPGKVIAMGKRPWKLTQLDRANWQGFWQAISDPVPHMSSYLRS